MATNWIARQQKPHGERGTGLIITMVMIVAVSLLIATMFNATQARSNIETASADGWVRFNGADAGLERARFMVARNSNEAASNMQDKHWLRYWAGTSTGAAAAFARNTPTAMRPVVWEDGNDYFNIGEGSSGVGKVQVFILDAVNSASDGASYSNWFLVIARTEMKNATTASATLIRPRDYFSKYARYTKSDLTISADNTVYGGAVHSNGKINLTAENALFKGLVSAVTTIDISGQATGTEPVFEKGSAEGVASVTPTAAWSTIAGVKAELPGGAVIYDPTDTTFKATVKAATGYEPSDSDIIEVEFVFENDKMTAVTKVYDSVSYSNNWYDDYLPQYGTLKATYTETSIDTPQNAPLYVNGNAKVSGKQSKRNTVIADKVFLNGPIRYVNNTGDPQYSVYENNGSVATFDEANQEWLPSTTQKWDDPNDSTAPNYKTTTGWTQPTDSSGNGFNPVLGIVSINGSWDLAERPDGTAYMNTENHAYIMSINDVHHSTHQLYKAYAKYYTGGGWTSPTQGYNNMILGGLATYQGSPVWDRRYNHINFDTNLTKDPPPGFPTIPNPTFSNWHQVTTSDNGDGTFSLVNHDIVNAWQ